MQTDIVFHLAYGYLLLGQADKALAIIDQGRQRSIPDHEVTTRVEIEALCDLDRETEVVERFAARIENLANDAMVIFGRACLEHERVDLLELARDILLRRSPTDESAKATRILQHLHWEALLRQGRNDEVRQELAESGVTHLNATMCDGVFAIRACAGDPSACQLYEDRVVALAPACFDLLEVAMASQWMLHARRFDVAIEMLERLLPTDAFSPLHVDLLRCYALADQRAKARDLLLAMPSEWRHSDDAREAALHVYSKSGDWLRMRELAELVVADKPQEASAWLMLIHISANQSIEQMLEVVARLPSSLLGTAKDQLRIANVELTHHEVGKGLRRIYGTMRCNLSDPEAAAGHLSVMIMAAEGLGEVDEVPEHVRPGTSVDIVDAQGHEGRLSIDTEAGTSLPRSTEFIAADSPSAIALIGLRMGETFSLPHLIGTQTYTIKRIQTIHHRLLELSREQVFGSVLPSKTLMAMHIPKLENGDMDLSFFVEQLEQRKAQGLETINVYRQHMATLGLIARMLNADVVDLVRDWPHEGQPLEVSLAGGIVSEKFRDDTAPASDWVIDLSMLVELASLDMLHLLDHLPQVYVTTLTIQALQAKIQASARYRKGGTLYTQDGRLGLQEKTEALWLQGKEFLEAIQLTIDHCCRVVPAYGPRSPSPELHTLKDIMSEEEHATLLTCLEYESGLLSLDGRLRTFAMLQDIVSASPQLLLYEMVDQGHLREVEYSCALIKMVMARRSFISIRAVDLIAMMDQGEAFANAGLNALRGYLAEPTLELKGAIPIVSDFVGLMYMRGRCTVPVMLQLVEYCIEPLYRHPNCPDDLHNLVFHRLIRRLELARPGKNAIAAIANHLVRAKLRAERPLKSVVLDARVSYAYAWPLYIALTAAELAPASTSVAPLPAATALEETQTQLEEEPD
ncbi:hypothetical protein PMM47T1_17050 [Pseudomonas sp. M47T1]|uniref:tetratricopeptide repeat protein n=1 Tax=Pseudomonas sp. M47T1 TaxID=1179778 RepID=UPI0002608AFE|nr:hypothetical protein [Pseudomonas sp. M47T1]EIK95514.1 hypothetical protein PMM47T1_17050 [Pseudomonas sp. M47T1]